MQRKAPCRQPLPQQQQLAQHRQRSKDALQNHGRLLANAAPSQQVWISVLVRSSAVGACLKIRRGAVFAGRAGWRGTRRENTLHGSSTKEQRSQTARPAKTLRAAGLLSLAFVGADLTARFGDARSASPRPKPKSLAAAPLPISRQALTWLHRSIERDAGRGGPPGRGESRVFKANQGWQTWIGGKGIDGVMGRHGSMKSKLSRVGGAWLGRINKKPAGSRRA